MENRKRDELLAHQVKNHINKEMRESALYINVSCLNGCIQLSGIVDVLSEKMKSEDIARSIDGIKKIENGLTVSMDSNFNDKHMEKEVTNKLRKSNAFNSISVKMEDGVANLIGSSDTLKKAKTAYHLASEVRGVKDVVNNVKINTYGEIDDATLNSRVTQALSNTDLSYPDINHDVKKGRLTLGGYVNNQKEVEIAKEIATGVEGIRKVINRLKIRKDEEKPF